MVGSCRETGALLAALIFWFCVVVILHLFAICVESAWSPQSLRQCWQVAFLHCCAFAALPFYIILFLFFRIFRIFVWSALRRESQRHCWQVAAWEEAFRAQYGQLHNYNQRFQLLFVQNPLLEINFCCRHISENFAFISFSHIVTHLEASEIVHRHLENRGIWTQGSLSAQFRFHNCFVENLNTSSWQVRFLKTSICLSAAAQSTANCGFWMEPKFNGWGNPPKIQLLRVQKAWNTLLLLF